ncbi:MAG: ribosome-associated translation inhibitor RaiA [Hellea sp.]|jgi:ribosomal subunit interface protein|nr:ribosome-associated translation inhibitor RaiA [Hellea sp.]MBT4996771.1 ribosome-associated translation inhibitor RaiA [Hellea sp.]MBT7398312.1 ribosome-associated translation inhibitor RaiA [Hellea sp.]MDA8887976.1 ribosome-associated translation inhibitor RaiA [Hellea sp.]MDC0650991.1 ribosome-associated translation inhibitor RaiA [Hellea sp.]
MQIQIFSKGIDVSTPLRNRITGRLEEMIDKYIHREGEAQVSVSKEGSGFKTVCSIHLPSGATMEGQGVASDAYAASNEALEHIEKRLRRYKRRLKDHSKQAKAKNGTMFVLENPITDNSEDDMEYNGNTEPLVIAEKSSKIRTLTPGMAAFELGLADNGVVVFNNARHGGLNVVFKRSDGNIGWIDPSIDNIG